MLGVAVGQSIYPTPVGRFQIIVKQREPLVVPAELGLGRRREAGAARARAIRSARAGWASPRPASACTARPTRRSIGYSASHGCIRMRIPDAEWLFEHVRVGSPVWIIH